MNKIFKKIWSKSRGCFMAVSEFAKTATHSKLKASVLTLAGGLFGSAIQAAVVLEGNVLNADPRLPNKYNGIFSLLVKIQRSMAILITTLERLQRIRMMIC